MELKASTLKAIQDDYPGNGGQMEWMAKQLRFMNDAARAVVVYAEMKDDARKECDQKIAEIDARLAVELAPCRHYQTTFHADPAGNDSSTVCDVCGKRL